ncbi:MAG: mechanosensitive ion channel [Chloroflexi bacterium]|nr:MAG: mechanosensitive ion channel [Chloroflexota bacterium]TMF21307.1 MAG: mechanosensitive ion channel [Chloroflexota bacterium]TMF29061.1 MAG: mechanosensitive ion channel [Chloroflexota bacterium]TMF48960.1 MAG: mechanosensitive ion channel [Chloroflexota bacterium]TMG26618.1 MAG: mechanosensitive ion channel [Chloroflexota bacterium]
MMPAASSGGIHFEPSPENLLFVAIGLVVLFVFIVASRFVSRFAGEQLMKRHVRAELVVISRRIVTSLVIGLGLFAALSFAVQSANVALFGLVLATVVAALGVQDLLRDYVSGYYVLLERHIRIGDRISFDTHTGTVSEVRLRVTLLRSEGGDVVIVPNSELFTKPVTIHGTTPEEEAKKAPPT